MTDALTPEDPTVTENNEQAATNAGVARATGVIAAGNISSRVLGLAREIALASLFGASPVLAAFNNAVIIPKTFYDLLIGGHVNSALIPVLSEAEGKQGKTDFWQLVSVLVSFVTVVMSGLTLLLMLFAPQVVTVMTDPDPSILPQTVTLLRWIAPALLFLSLFAVLSGTLYALRSFTYPAFAGALFNASIVSITILLSPTIGIRAAALGWLVGAAAQLMLQLPGLRGARLHLTFDWTHPGLRQIGLLYIPVSFSLVLDTLLLRPFSYQIANEALETGVVYMVWATTLIQFPQGLVATAISIAILPTLSRQATEFVNGAREAFKNTLGLGLRLAITLILPATVGLFVLATPIVDLLFIHGAENALQDTTITVLALRLYLLGLPFAALDLLLIYAFYARQDTLTPALIGVLSLVVYMVVAVALVPSIGLFSLMIADSVKHLIHACVSGYILLRRLGGLGRQDLLSTTLKAGAAALAMGVVGVVLVPTLTEWLPAMGFISEGLVVAMAGAVCGVVFVGIAYALNVSELTWVLNAVWRRLRGLTA